MYTIICWKWDNGLHPKKDIIFSAEHINILYAMLKRSVKVPFELVCITDNAVGLHKDIRIVKLWNDYMEKGGCFVRLKVFSDKIQELLKCDRFLSIDIDTVIVGDMTPFVTACNDFIIYGNIWRKFVYCGSLFGLNCGCRQQVWDKFNPDDHQFNGRGTYSGGTDQKHINNMLYPGEAMWTEKDGIYNFSTDIMRYKNQIIMKHRENKIKGGDGFLPDNARVVFFNGKYDPSHKELQKEYPWILKHWHL